MNAHLNLESWDDTNLSTHTKTQIGNIIPLDKYRQAKSTAITIGWKEKVGRQLQDLYAESITDHFEFNIESAQKSEQFIQALPEVSIDTPTLSVEAEGYILIEWYKKSFNEDATIFSVILRSENYIYSLLKKGIPTIYGTLNYSEDSLEMLLSLLEKNFGIENARLKAT